MGWVGRAGVVVGLRGVGGRSAFGGFLWWVVCELEAGGGGEGGAGVRTNWFAMLCGLEDEVVVLEGLWLILRRCGVVAGSLIECDEVVEVICGVRL